MTVLELINSLEKVEDKSIEVYIAYFERVLKGTAIREINSAGIYAHPLISGKDIVVLVEDSFEMNKNISYE